MIPWFKKHPEWLRSESGQLSRDGNYKELFQERNALFVSHGQLLVRLDKIHRFPVLIVYPESTPFELPTFFILKETLSAELVSAISRMSLESVYGAVHPYIHFYYELRHQNSSGALCTIEWDNLDDGTNYIGIASLLKRVREWFAGTITGVFPPDSQEIELAAHFVDVDREIKFIYPESFLDPRLVSGEAYAQQYTYIPQVNEYVQEYRLYMGCLLVGENSEGITLPIADDIPGLFNDPGFAGPADLWTKPAMLAQKLESKEWLKCYWFQLDAAPHPFQTVDQLVAIIGVKRLHKQLYEQLKAIKPGFFFIGLRFPNRRGELEFQLFKVYKTLADQPMLWDGTAEEKMAAFLASYTRVAAIESEKLTDGTFHLRNSGRADREKLHDKVINIIGCGALGSEIADAAGKAGPGKILLFDNQRMKAHNAVRHVAGFNQIGLSKVSAVAGIIRQHNPFVLLDVLAGDINRVNMGELLSDGSLSVSSIADDNIEAYLNERAVLSGQTVFYARALRGGKAARIFRVIPGRDACFQCLNLYREDEAGFIEVPADETMPTLKNECNNPVRPASAADLKLISALASRLVLDHLQNEPTSTNQWIWTSEAIAGAPQLKPWSLHEQTLTPHPRCPYCHHERKMNVSIDRAALSQMQALVAENPDIETGGILAGYTAEDGLLHIKYASGPGPNAIGTAKKFEKDVAYCQSWLNDLLQEKSAVYLGEWHSHPSLNNQPSGTDLKSLSEIAVQDDYLTAQPVMAILSNEGIPSFTLHPANKVYYTVEAEII